MTTKPCLDCGRLTRAGSRCPRCARLHEAARGSRQQRGYDADHDTIRRRLIATAVEAGGRSRCPLCPRPIDVTLPGTHPDGPQLHHLAGKVAGNAEANYALAHALCNQQAGDPTQRSAHGRSR